MEKIPQEFEEFIHKTELATIHGKTVNISVGITKIKDYSAWKRNLEKIIIPDTVEVCFYFNLF